MGLVSLVNDGNNFDDKIITLSNDIDLKNVHWIPIGTETNHFKGTFKGNEKTISNVYINEPALVCAGLFGKVAGANVDLTVRNAIVTGSE